MRITQVGTLQKPRSVSILRKYRIMTVMEAMEKNIYFSERVLHFLNKVTITTKSLDRSKSQLHPLSPSGYCLCHLVWHSNILHYEHGVHSCDLYDSQNKRRLFLYAVITDSFYDGGACSPCGAN
jgi:hypothetical protein